MLRLHQRLSRAQGPPLKALLLFWILEARDFAICLDLNYSLAHKFLRVTAFDNVFELYFCRLFLLHLHGCFWHVWGPENGVLEFWRQLNCFRPLQSLCAIFRQTLWNKVCLSEGEIDQVIAAQTQDKFGAQRQ